MGEGASVEQAKGLFSYARIGPTVGQPVGEGGWQEERYSTAVPAGEPSNEFGERRGVSPPVASPDSVWDHFEVPTGGLTARRSLGNGSRNSRVGFLLPPPQGRGEIGGRSISPPVVARDANTTAQEA